jgi:hypothetical protein
LFEHRAVFQYAGATTTAAHGWASVLGGRMPGKTAFGALPAVFGEARAAVALLQRRANTVLQRFQIAAYVVKRVHGANRCVPVFMIPRYGAYNKQ